MFGRHSKITVLSSLRPADHICIWDRSKPIDYQHHGIVWERGDTPETISVVHIWSPLEGVREAQADSHFRISTLKEFLYNRNIKDLRLVQYHVSGLKDIVSRWGEVHLAKSDIPEVVLARAKFLLGLGKQKFNILTQNCEHAAHWCKTGEQWCKQSLTKGRGKVPFEDMATPERIDQLEKEIEEKKAKFLKDIEVFLSLGGSYVYLQVNDKYLVRCEGKAVEVIAKDDPVKQPTPFRLFCYCKGYNCIKVSFFLPESQEYMYSHSSISGAREIEVRKRNCFQSVHGTKWELSPYGELQSMHQHRRYIGINKDLLVDVSKREDAARFAIIPAEKQYAESNGDFRLFLEEEEEENTKITAALGKKLLNQSLFANQC